jgi:hypothetical protein
MISNTEGNNRTVINAMNAMMNDFQIKKVFEKIRNEYFLNKTINESQLMSLAEISFTIEGVQTILCAET